MRTAENIVAIPMEFRIRDVRDVEAQINNLVDFRGYSQIRLNFSDCRVAFAEALIPLVCYCQKMITDSVRFQIDLPVFDKLRRLFINCGWANLIAPRQFNTPGVEMGDNIPAIVFRDHSKQDWIVNSSIDRVLKKIPNIDRENLGALEWSINEICDNVLNHSQSDIGGIFQLNFRTLSKEVEFIVADSGIGIPRSLRSIRHQEWTDEFALEKSIQQGITRDPNFGQGNGLFGTYQIAALSGGTFHINSGYAHLVATRGGLVQVRADSQPFSGTVVVCAVNYSEPRLLERALSFKGTDFRMVDLVELQYEIDDSAAEFILRNEADSLGSRRSGYEIRNKVKNLLYMLINDRLVFDMDDVGVMSSSFADELFAKLALSMGTEAYRRRISFKNLSDINRQLIQRALTQRLGLES